MRSPQTLSEADRRRVAAWAADCAERVLGLFEAAAPADERPRAAIARARAFARGELDTADEIVIHCKSGVRSAKAIALLNEAGYRGLRNLQGEILAWIKDVDPSLPSY